MKAEDAEDFKAILRKEAYGLHSADDFDVIPLSDKPKNRKLIKFA